MVANIDIQTKNFLKEYVEDFKCEEKCGKKIEEFCSKQPKQSLTVYRGQKKGHLLDSNPWHSATTDKNIAREEFAGENGYVLKINLINVPVINVCEYIGDEISHYGEEQEYIFLGGGVCFTSKEMNEEGFKYNRDDNNFECWYEIRNINNLFEEIDPDEYDFIDDYNDIVFSNINLNFTFFI